MSSMNPMRAIRIEKLVINCSLGGEADQLTKAARVLEQLTGQTPAFSNARLTIRGFNIRRGQRSACHVTVRGEKAREILERGLRVKGYELPRTCFSETGNCGFGITEHIDLGIKYDPAIGIFGMDFYVVTGRPGNRVSQRRRRTNRVGFSHRVTKQEAMDWVSKEFDVALI